jgi:hypothetical protein
MDLTLKMTHRRPVAYARESQKLKYANSISVIKESLIFRPGKRGIAGNWGVSDGGFSACYNPTLEILPLSNGRTCQ